MRNHQTVFLGNCTILCSHQQCVRVPVFHILMLIFEIIKFLQKLFFSSLGAPALLVPEFMWRPPAGQPALPRVGYMAQDWHQRAGWGHRGSWGHVALQWVRLSVRERSGLFLPSGTLFPSTPPFFLRTRPQPGTALAAPLLRFVCVSRHQDKCSYKQCGGLGANLSDAVRGCDSEYINIFT